MSADATTATPHGALSGSLAEFAWRMRDEDIPERVRTIACYLMLDAVGIAFASLTQDWAHRAYTGLRGLGGPGNHVVIGLPDRLPARDAAAMNGMLVHGLDYDDTHLAGVIHTSSSQLPVALAAAEATAANGRALLTAFIVGSEAASRIAMAAGGLFHQAGFNTTGTVGSFGAALSAGRLLGLNARQLAMAQGIVLGMGSSSLAFVAEGAWTKRLYPGWAAASGLTAAALARQGFTGPQDPYLGRHGLYRTHLGGVDVDTKVDPSRILDGLGERWEVERIAIKPYPACHFAHGCIEAALELRELHGLDADRIESVRAVVHPALVEPICEPEARKRRPASVYEAQFSLHYLVAVALHRGALGLAELDPVMLSDPSVLAIVDRVRHDTNPAIDHPRYFGGEVEVILRDGTRLFSRKPMNLGCAERPVSPSDIERKFLENATLSMSPAKAEAIRDAILGLDRNGSAAALAGQLAG